MSVVYLLQIAGKYAAFSSIAEEKREKKRGNSLFFYSSFPNKGREGGKTKKGIEVYFVPFLSPFSKPSLYRGQRTQRRRGGASYLSL